MEPVGTGWNQLEPVGWDNRNTHDKVSFQTVCEDGHDMELDIVDVTRLGPKQEGKIRPLRVKLPDEKLKMKILRNAIQLSRTADDYLETVFIKKDMTRMEMKEDKKLREQLKEIRAESLQKMDGAKWKIHRGKIVNTTRQTLIIPEIGDLNDRE